MTDPKSNTKSILSFDVGIRHLAYCHLSHDGWDASTIKINAWDVIDLGPVASVEICADKLMAELKRRFAVEAADLVLIERQPRSRSVIMVAVQMFLCAYFSQDKARFKAVKFISAQRKLAMQLLPDEMQSANRALVEDKSKKYAENKKYAIQVTRHYLETLGDFGNLVLLDMYPKKDDLCDSYLQAVAYVEGGGRTGKVHVKTKGRRTRATHKGT